MKKQRHAITTWFGLIGGIACVAIAIAEAGNLSLFVNIPSLLIIVGGTICVLVMSFPFSTLKTIGAVIKEAFTQYKYAPMDDINTLMELSEKARREGLLALENYSETSDDEFLKRGLSLLADGVDREALEASMLSAIHHTQKRHRSGASMISMIASVAPGLGLVGTYVGLIPMLVDMRDPDKLGPMMAIELVSSFYGGLLANVIFSPMAKKLQSKSAQEKERNELILEGILGIHEGKNPRLIREDLLAYLTKKESAKIPKPKGKNVPEGKVLDYKKTMGA